MSYLCNLDTLKTIYFSYFHSRLCFGISLYGATSKTNLNKILILQKRAIRIMMHLKFDESVRAHFRQLNILTVYGQYIFETICLAKEDIMRKEPVETHQYNTRHKKDIVTTRHNLEFYKKKPTYTGGLFILKLPPGLKGEQNYKSFKTNLKTYLTEKVLYSIEEYFDAS